MDHEMGHNWITLLRGLKKKITEGDPSRERVDQLIFVLPKTFSHIAVKKGLVEEVDRLIRECEDPKKLYDMVNDALGKADHGSVDTLIEDYKKRREEQIKSAPEGFYPKQIYGLDEIFEGQVVTPTVEGKGKSWRYQLNRLERRLKEFGKTSFKNDPRVKELMSMFGREIEDIKGNKYGSKYGRALRLQGINIHISTLKKDWMNKMIDKLVIPGAEEAISDLRNLAVTASHVARTPDLIAKIVNAIQANVADLKNASQEQKIETVNRLRDHINSMLVSETYMSHSGVEETHSPLSALFAAYQKELLRRDGNMDEDYVQRTVDSFIGEERMRQIKEKIDWISKRIDDERCKKVKEEVNKITGKNEDDKLRKVLTIVYDIIDVKKDPSLKKVNRGRTNIMDLRYDIRDFVQKGSQRVVDVKSAKDALKTIVYSNEHGLAEAEAITRKIMNSDNVKKLSSEDKQEIEKYVNTIFRKRDTYMRDLNELFKRLAEATLGKGVWGTPRTRRKKVIPFGLVARDPRVRKLSSRMLGVLEDELNDKAIENLHKSAERGEFDELLKIFLDKKERIPLNVIIGTPEIRELIARTRSFPEKGLTGADIEASYIHKLYSAASSTLEALNHLDKALHEEKLYVPDKISELIFKIKGLSEGKKLNELPSMVDEINKIVETARINHIFNVRDKLVLLAKEASKFDKLSVEKKAKEVPKLMKKLGKLQQEARSEEIPKTIHWKFANFSNESSGIFKALVNPAMMREKIISARK
jgi:hypothetical protein